MYTVDTLVQTALAETGYLEKRSLSGLDDQTANAGAGNYTKYARDLHKAGYYNGSKQGVAWCNVFVDWCHYMAAGKQKAIAQKASCQSGPYGAGCKYSMGYYQTAGQFVAKDPQPGDQIYFGTAHSVDHTGIVWKVENGRVYTVEGNTSPASGVVGNGGGVFQKSYPLNHSRILGYGRPVFAKAEKSFDMKMQVQKKGSSGETVKALQLLLIGNGCPCGSWGADGKFGAATEKAVFRYQKEKGLQQDGMAGPETWGSLLSIA